MTHQKHIASISELVCNRVVYKLAIRLERVCRRCQTRAGLLWNNDSINGGVFLDCIAEELIMPCGVESSMGHDDAGVVVFERFSGR